MKETEKKSNKIFTVHTATLIANADCNYVWTKYGLCGQDKP
jgi:hypothetical protein